MKLRFFIFLLVGSLVWIPFHRTLTDSHISVFGQLALILIGIFIHIGAIFCCWCLWIGFRKKPD